MNEEIEKKLWALLSEARDTKNALLVGRYEEAYQLIQGIDDELTTMIINNNSEADLKETKRKDLETATAVNEI